jgi:thiamine biosynthesis protein ThiS
MNLEQRSTIAANAAESIRVYINGEAHHLPARQTVADLLATLKIPAERVAVELNKTIVRKREWQSTLVGDGAQVEIVEFVGGG